MAEINKPQDTKQPTINPALAGNGIKDNARDADAAVRRTAEAAEQVGRAAGEALRRAGDAASETAKRGGQALAETQRRIVQDAAERLEEVSRKVAEATQGTTENVRRLFALPNAAEGGLRDIQQGVVGLVEGVVQTNLRVAQELFRLSNPAPIVELQQRFVREYTDTLVRNGTTLVRAVRRTADETLRPLEEQLAQQRYKTAAE